jgi:hypothetical protein
VGIVGLRPGRTASCSSPMQRCTVKRFGGTYIDAFLLLFREVHDRTDHPVSRNSSDRVRHNRRT